MPRQTDLLQQRTQAMDSKNTGCSRLKLDSSPSTSESRKKAQLSSQGLIGK